MILNAENSDLVNDLKSSEDQALSSQPATVYVVDDDELTRESACELVRSMNFQAVGFESAESFLGQYAGNSGCVVTDYRMTGMNGIELQEELIEQGFEIPVILVTGFARTSMAVRAIQNGAVTMLDKPYSEDELWSAIRAALSLDKERRAQKRRNEGILSRLATLNEKEKQVLDMIVAGESNKAMAKLLDVSLRTIENRRRSVFTKLQTDTVAELVAMVLRSQE